MAPDKEMPLIDDLDVSEAHRMSQESDSSVSTTSIVFDRITERLATRGRPSSPRQSPRQSPPTPRRNGNPYADRDNLSDFDEQDPLKEESSADLETGPFLPGHVVHGGKRMDPTLKRLLLVLSGIFVAAWVIALVAYVSSKAYDSSSAFEQDPQATVSRGTGKKITLDQVRGGFFAPERHSLTWIRGADGEDGLLLEENAEGEDFLVVRDIRSKSPPRTPEGRGAVEKKTLMKNPWFVYGGTQHVVDHAEPSPDQRRVLVATNSTSNWRHSFAAQWWIFNVDQQSPEPLVPGIPGARVQLVTWSPSSDAVVFTKDNDMYLRRIGSQDLVRITKTGGPDYFNGIPDWVYEEEVLAGPSATYWSQDAAYIAFMFLNESRVPEYPVEFFIKSPSGKRPPAGEENYPETKMMKYPKAGAPNPEVDLLFYDIKRGEVFSVSVDGAFPADNRLIVQVVWAGDKVLVKETNRVCDVLHVVLVDVKTRTGKIVRNVDFGKLDGGWYEHTWNARYIPADPTKKRPHDGYIDTVAYDNGAHLAYFTPLDNPDPIMLTKGNWEVEEYSPSAVDLSRNLVYFVATKVSSIQRHVYSVRLDGTSLEPLTDTSVEGYYSASFSSGSGYVLLNYHGPSIPWQKVLSTPGNPIQYQYDVVNNTLLADRVKKHELPLKVYGTLNVDGVELNYVERRPPHFDAKKRYPVLFYLYNGPGSQQVAKKFEVDFQSYVAAALGYLVVTVDGRGTGFIGRSNRVVVRGKLGQWETHDQIAAARHWASLPYVDASRIAIWGWSYGGYMTLKTLEQDAGRTFRYGMAVAPVTDWRFYDSIYAERYMGLPQDNGPGYDRAAVLNASALGQSVRFLLMHGSADDNVHVQNSFTLLDRLNKAGVENYDMQFFPDSDHSIYFHNANTIVFHKLANWITNAFNGEWIKVNSAKPEDRRRKSAARST